MQLAGINVERTAVAALAEAPYHRWVAFGPAAGRAAISLAVDQSDPVRALNYLAGQSGARPNVLATLADQWLASDISSLVDNPVELLTNTAAAGAPSLNPPPPPFGSIWNQQPKVNQMLNAEARDLRQILEEAAFAPGPTPRSAAVLAHDLFAYAPDPRPGMNLPGPPPSQTYYSTLAMQAEAAAPAVQQVRLQPIDRAQFQTAAGFLGAGAAGVATGALASALGAPSLLSFGLGGVVGAGALWFLASRLPSVDLRPAWEMFDKIVDGVIDFVIPGSGPIEEPDAFAPGAQVPAANALGSLVTSTDSGVVDALYDATWE